MKIFRFLNIAAANARRDESGRNEFFDCGGLTEFNDEIKSVEIFSPIDFAASNDSSKFYPYNAFCEWDFHDDCADSFRIDTTYFDIEGNPRCVWDSLTITNGDSTYNSTFCNRFNNVDDYFSDDYWGEPESWAEFEDLVPGEPVFIPGNSMSITFISDGVINHSGFQLSISPVRDDQTCSFTENKPVCVWPYKEHNTVFMKAWNIGSQDKLTPFSNYADSFNDDDNVGILSFRKQCAGRCRDTPGCFKFMLDGASTCLLRGNELENRNHDSYAINGEDCPSEPSTRLWKDFKTRAVVFCKFYDVSDAIWYLNNRLLKYNPQALKWAVTDEKGATLKRRMSRKWTFAIADDKNSGDGVWYSFESTAFIREYLVPVNETSATTTSTGTFGRRKRETNDSDVLVDMTGQIIQDFIENLDIGDAQVVETEISDIEVESLDPIDDTPSNHMIYSYTKLRDFLEVTMAEASTRRPGQKMKQFRRVTERFSWFYEHTFDSCENPTTAPFGTEKWTIPEVGTDICDSFVSLMDSTMEYYDHKVCLDRIDLKENRRAYRRNGKIVDDVRRSKKVFNRLLKALDCPQRLDVN
ncbi:Oidioi.mRNA.OKI2018_I69.PAR.g9613.t1.cds [Oikopleura dioica]|uniref:Oidioi.mRNA.OKI2018_I69.PAR.g9613.t1.cds n=1 Tax=Oikopleura dioica TaxID=34765 RepID=A0ABN7RQM8_OIKDI|nr:Oidioi.mRNA.OKI2018_I69.PAR.g9613.t1.cds [Oikopleura dioica]